MNDRLKTYLQGAAEAFGIGLVAGLGSVWGQPTDVVLTGAGLAAAGLVAAKFGVIYLLGFLRMNAGLQK